jgi:hypothetical protein
VKAQALEHRSHGPADVFFVLCERCGAEREFVFDISPFFAKVDRASFESLLGDHKRLWEMYVFNQHRMEAVLKYLSELAKDGDVLALEYVGGAVQHFMSQASNRPADQV